MCQINAPTRAVRTCREITGSFVTGEIDYASFRSQMDAAMGPLDPLDLALADLDEAAGAEAKMYVEWVSTELGKPGGRIPIRSGWKYGKSNEPYGWVDQVEYRNRLRDAFAGILELNT